MVLELQKISKPAAPGAWEPSEGWCPGARKGKGWQAKCTPAWEANDESVVRSHLTGVPVLTSAIWGTPRVLKMSSDHPMERPGVGEWRDLPSVLDHTAVCWLGTR